MGKKNFKKIYNKVKADSNGQVSCKISAFSDEYASNNNYAGVIVYGYDGKTSWTNLKGQANNYNGKSFYIIVKNTEGVQPRPRDGMVHYLPLESVLGIEEKDQTKILCGGFAYQNGQLKFNSVWFNKASQKGLEGNVEEHDGNKEMSAGEIALTKYCWDKYVKEGPNAVFDVLSDVERRILSA